MSKLNEIDMSLSMDLINNKNIKKENKPKVNFNKAENTVSTKNITKSPNSKVNDFSHRVL